MNLFNIFRPKWRNSDYQVRLNAIKSLANQSVLAKIAMNDSQAIVCEAAVEKLNDQVVITEVAKNASSRDIRIAAVKKITSQEVLEEIAKNDRDIFVRKAAIKAAVKTITDQTALANIAMNESNDTMREAAVENITDQAVLAEVAKNDRISFVREAAVKKITDQTTLANLVMDDSYDHSIVRDIAVENLIEQTLLEKVAKSGKYLRQAAVKKLNDQAVLTELAMNASDDFSVRKAALEKITDQAVLEQIAMNDSNFLMRTVTFKKIINQEILAEIAKNNNDFNVSYAAFEHITDQIVLVNLAKYSTGYLRIAAVKKLTDQALLAEIVKIDTKNNSDKSVREAAVEKLTDQALLAEIAKNDSDFFVREAARKKITDQTVIAEIAKNKLRTPDKEIGWYLRGGNKIIADLSTTTFATGVVRPLTTALFFDYLWIPKELLDRFIRYRDLPKDVFKILIADPITSNTYHLAYITNSKDAVWYKDNKYTNDSEYIESHIELFRDDHYHQSNKNVFFPSSVTGTKHRDKALREISHLYQGQGIPLVPVYHNPLDYDGVAGSEQTGLELCLDFIPIPLEGKLSWDQVLQFRKDKDAKEKLLRLRRWTNGTLSRYTHSQAIDEIAKRVDDYEWALKKHGIETVLGGVTSVLSFAGGPAAVQLLSGSLYAAIAAGVTVGAGVLAWTGNRLIERMSLQRSEVAYIYEVRKLDRSVNVITSPNV